MAAKQKPEAPERLPGAEGKCVNREQEEIVRWFRTVKFRRTAFGGVDEVQLWKKLEELYGLYGNAIRAERARYDALLQQAGVIVPPTPGLRYTSGTEEASGPGEGPSVKEGS